MSPAKKYFWLKLKEDFFSQKEIKKLRKIAGGDTFTIIYLKLQLLSIKQEGKLYFEGIEDSFCEEMALTLDENVDNVKMTLMFMQKYGLMEEVTPEEYFLPQASESIGSETQGAERVRKHREQQKALQCNNNVTEMKLIETSCNDSVIESNTIETKCNTEIEKEIDIDKDIRSICPNFQSDDQGEVSKDFFDYELILPNGEIKHHDINHENCTSLSKDFKEADAHSELCTALSKKLFEYMKINNPKVKEPNFLSWSKSIDLMIRVDKRTPAEIEKMIQWCQKDSFWRLNILSTDKLRQKYDQLYLKMTAPANGPNKNSSSQTHNVFQRREYQDGELEKYYVDVTS